MKNDKISKGFKLAIIALFFLNIIVVPYYTRDFELVDWTFDFAFFALLLLVAKRLFLFVFGKKTA